MTGHLGAHPPIASPYLMRSTQSADGLTPDSSAKTARELLNVPNNYSASLQLRLSRRRDNSVGSSSEQPVKPVLRDVSSSAGRVYVNRRSRLELR